MCSAAGKSRTHSLGLRQLASVLCGSGALCEARRLRSTAALRSALAYNFLLINGRFSFIVLLCDGRSLLSTAASACYSCCCLLVPCRLSLVCRCAALLWLAVDRWLTPNHGLSSLAAASCLLLLSACCCCLLAAAVCCYCPCPLFVCPSDTTA